jgi:hypothetical protein
MKKLIIALAAVMISVASYGQAQLNFSTRVAGAVDFPIFAPDGTTAAGLLGNVSAQLYLVDGATLTPLQPTTTFRTAAGGEAYLSPVSVTIPGNAGTPVQLVLRAFQGSNYDTALIRGETSPFSATPALAPATPTALTGLGTGRLQLEVIPEPSTYALAALGLGALVLFRRRK